MVEMKKNEKLQIGVNVEQDTPEIDGFEMFPPTDLFYPEFSTDKAIKHGNKFFYKLRVGVNAEWDIPAIILMHTPGDEVFYGMLHPKAALYEETFDNFEAVKEHKIYTEVLKEMGGTKVIQTKVIQIVDVLLDGTLNEDGSKKEGEELTELIEFADKSLIYNIPSNWSLDKIAEQKQYKKKSLKELHPKQLVKIILERPTVYLRDSQEGNTDFIPKYEMDPLMNMYFLRDQQITTDKGVVIGKMNSSQRGSEIDVMEFVFKKMEINPIYKIKGAGRLEGGDYIPAGGFALIGQGLRTNEEGIRQLLENDVFGFKEIVVVKDPYQSQDQMHLDTYFNILGPKKAIVDEIRRNETYVDGNGIKKKIRPTVDVYKRTPEGKYKCERKNLDFFEYLEGGKKFEIINIEHEDQLKYGCNFLCVGENTIIGIKGREEYGKKLRESKVRGKLLNFRNMTKGYGAAHCVTQVICRVDPLEPYTVAFNEHFMELCLVGLHRIARRLGIY